VILVGLFWQLLWPFLFHKMSDDFFVL